MDSEEDCLLDDTWIVEFEKTHKLYHDYYKDDLYYTNLHFIYVNKDSEITKIKQESFLMSSCNSVSREEVVGLLKRNSTEDNVKYSILSILRYNITLDVEDVGSFMKNTTASYESFLTTIKNIDAIRFERTINLFHDLNDLLFIFYEKTEDTKQHNSTKRVFFKQPQSNHKKTHRRHA